MNKLEKSLYAVEGVGVAVQVLRFYNQISDLSKSIGLETGLKILYKDHQLELFATLLAIPATALAFWFVKQINHE